MRYQFTVTFTRDKADDLEVAQHQHPELKGDEREALLQQLRDELQSTFDDGDLAGEFDIDRESYKEIE